MLTGIQIADKIEKESFNTQYDSGEVEPSFHGKLVTELYKRGWKEYNSLSRCKVAYGGENHMEKEGRKIEIITSSFMGTFTLVNTF